MYNLRYIPFVIIGVFAIVFLIVNVKRKKFSEKDSLIWAFAGLILILSPFYMDYVDKLAVMVGVDYAPSLIFAMAFLFVFFLIYRLTATVHNLNEKVTELIQLNSIYENELRILKEKLDERDLKDGDNKS
ncbi:MAG: DUF2304 domain-containing protein [Oscillospiraceae bacterium]|nr:DUF2304 domain-containing protein [Oscillospiraceae bacterium]